MQKIIIKYIKILLKRYLYYTLRASLKTCPQLLLLIIKYLSLLILAIIKQTNNYSRHLTTLEMSAIELF